ncbi:MAG: glycogen debranching protein GlgX [Chromatiaceae bacterium]|nr:glycogen debranching protein GlgX [Candidatus Thioaporhodococcus sediminis]
MSPGPFATEPGRRYPPGVRVDAKGANFSLFSRHATGVELLLYQEAHSPEPFQVIRLDPEVNHTFFSWHVRVVGLPAGVHFTWRLEGPKDPRGRGLRFDPRVELLDPYARAVTRANWDRWRRLRVGVLPHDSLRALVLGDEDYDWEDDGPLHLPAEDMVIYELHVGGFTRHPSSGVRHPGTFAGLIEKIPYLQSLGITHVELMPVMAFDEQDVPPEVHDLGLSNFWGYSTHSFFSPHPGYCVSPEAGTQRREFRDLVKALHRAGIGVILDVVFNHTAEGGADGPLINFKGFGNESFYLLDGIDKSRYLDFTGCGHTVNANHPLVTRFIIDCLEYWVREMHVDGFRFDLASALARGEDGRPLHDPPVLWAIELSDVLAHTDIIAEAWDAAGLYQVGSFPGYRWMEWNGRYRDSVRRFVRGDGGLVGELASRIGGSSDLYQANQRLPINSINFVTCHDGFTLWDLVSYDRKHNQANGEGSRDGGDENLSWNGGTEGETSDPAIQALRRRQARNFMAILLLSQGVPMLLAGDEVLRTQGGNNNAWCQDNPTGWFDWDLVEANADMHRFVAGLIALRRRHPSLRRRRFLTGRSREDGGPPDIQWRGPEGGAPDWDGTQGHCLAFTLTGVVPGEPDLHVMINMGGEGRDFRPPDDRDQLWSLVLDTARQPALAPVPPEARILLRRDGLYLEGRSLVVLESLSSLSLPPPTDPAGQGHID